MSQISIISKNIEKCGVHFPVVIFITWMFHNLYFYSTTTKCISLSDTSKQLSEAEASDFKVNVHKKTEQGTK